MAQMSNYRKNSTTAAAMAVFLSLPGVKQICSTGHMAKPTKLGQCQRSFGSTTDSSKFL